jgi:SAM-dependent methyltransferase
VGLGDVRVLAARTVRAIDRRRMEVNRRKWDESVPLHMDSPDYDVPSFRRGRLTLHPLEIREVGPVRGRSLLHLQCHFGMDTLSWARLGARVTGTDFSGPASLAEELGIPATFVRSNVYDLPKALDGEFDIVYTAKGAIGWLPELRPWGSVIARFLKSGGRFYLLEDHPASDVFCNAPGTKDLVFESPYFGGRPQRWVTDGTYATKVRMKHRVSYGWNHSVSEVLTALLGAGLRLEAVHEFPYSFWKKFPFMRRGRDGWWHLKRRAGAVPLMWSVRATKPAPPASRRRGSTAPRKP